MVAAKPEISYMASRGYLQYKCFQQSLTECNPLAVRVVFDAISSR
jgi:hypothetical protein